MTDEYDGPERRQGLSEADIERIAEAAANKALDRHVEETAKKALELMYAGVGKEVVKRLVMGLGLIALAILMWMGGKGIHLP